MSDSGASGGGGDGGKQHNQQQEQQQVKFHMTVKLDIEGRQPSDLLLRLQPLFAAAAGGSGGGTNWDSLTSVQSSPAPLTTAEDSGALELSLGLSLGSSNAGGGGGSGGASLRRSQSLAAPLQAGEFLRSWSSDEAFLASQPPPQQQPQTTTTAASTTDSMEERRKRVAQSERRQEARKKRRILMNEQRAAMQGGGGAARTTRTKRAREDSLSPPRERREYSSGGGGGGGDEHRSMPPPLPPPTPSPAGATKVKVESSSKVKVEYDGSTASASGSGSVFRPSPIHAAQRFLGMHHHHEEQHNQRRPRHLHEDDHPQKASSQDHPSTSNATTTIDRTTSSSRDTLSSSLFRSASLGSSFGSFKSQQLQLHSTTVQEREGEQRRQEQLPAAVIAGSNDNNTANSQVSGLLRTLSEGSKLGFSTITMVPPSDSPPSSSLTRNKGVSAFRSPKKEPGEDRSFMKRSNSMSFGALTGGGGSTVGAVATNGTTSMSKFASGSHGGGNHQSLPLVSATGTGPDGKTVSGVLFAYKKGDVKIICACHGHHMTAKEFVEHAGGVNVVNPEKCIVVNPSMLTRSKSMINYCSSKPA